MPDNKCRGIVEAKYINMDTNINMNNEGPKSAGVNNANLWATPIAIVLAGALVALGVYFSRVDTKPVVEDNVNKNLKDVAVKIVEIKDTDHVQGSTEQSYRR